MATIYNDATDQYILFQAYNTSYAPLVGSTEGQALAGALLLWSEYKKADVSIESASVTWNSTLGLWKAAIPAGVITQNGPAVLTISGTGMTTLSIDIDVIAGLSPTKAELDNAVSPLATTASLNTIDIPTSTEIANAVLATTTRTGRSVAETLRIIEIMLTGSITGLIEGEGTPVTFTLAGSTIVFSVDDDGNRTLSSVTLV